MGAQPRIIVDTQVHLWKAATPDFPWVPGAKPRLAEPFTIERIVPMMDEAGVDDYALEAVRRYPGRFAVMGRIDVRDPESASLLPKWQEQPGMLGIRVTFLAGDAAMLSDGTLDWFWPAIEKARLPLMLLAPESAPALSRIAERHPQLTLILDHMGMSVPVRNAGRTASAINQTASLAKYPNVSVKLSGTTAYSFEEYPYRDFNPHIRRLFDAYGPRRCYWGTDLTFSFADATYRQRVTHFTEMLDFLSEEDKDWVMGRAILERLHWS
jgi:predicted TIM-barrel fold metal-dependent hydrolase